MFSLGDAEVLVVDCQTTGANPSRGALLELGWARVRASDPAPLEPAGVTARLVALPDGETIPRQVERITGVGAADLAGAAPPEQVWGELIDDGARAGGPAVIHFARFEEPFLRALHRDCSPGASFPFDIVCTHEIARRALPELPRRGLRALAGYFGLSVEQLRRSASHVAATAFVWSRLVDLLGDRFGVRTADDLCAWLAEPAPSGEPGRAYPMPRALRLSVPDRPGVYRMLRGNGDLLYVGKARSLRRRVNSYFNKRARVPDRTLEMLTQARDLDITETATALEAALLEVDEIKRAAPPYNVALVDRGRDVWFASRDLSHLTAAPDIRHPVGPLLQPDLILSFIYLRDLIAGAPVGEDSAARILGDRQNLPDATQLAVAVDALRDEVGTGRLLAMAEVAVDSELEEEPDAWTPERLAASLRRRVAGAAHAVRRARWLTALTDAALVWSDRLLVVERGRVSRRATVAAGTAAPPPPGAARPLLDRHRALDRATCDRLRVLTTELRRVVVEHGWVELRFGRRSLGRDRLQRTLSWI